MFDKAAFIPETILQDLPACSPKIEALFQRIEELDAKDQAKHGHKFKHMIFSGSSSVGYGAKIVLSVFAAKGYTIAFHPAGSGLGFVPMDDSNDKRVGALLSKPIFGAPMSSKFKKRTLELFNQRPENVHGEQMRFICLDGGFREGIDLFDVKYVHLLEPTPIRADEKQAIGRGTRFCGQKGLFFDPKAGWPLYVYRYETGIQRSSKIGAERFLDLQLQYSDIDMREVAFANELEKASSDAAADNELTKAIHEFSIKSGVSVAREAKRASSRLANAEPVVPDSIMKHAEMSAFISKYYKRFLYPQAKLENGCLQQGGEAQDEKDEGEDEQSDAVAPVFAGGAPVAVDFTPSQNFVRHFFQPASAYKGMLLCHSVGTGKTCSAVATASTSWEKEGYTILWVTRHTLKADISKNLYKWVCSIPMRERLAEGKKIGKAFLSKNWLLPISYKQFSNMLKKKNKVYAEMVRRNGEKDPLRKTLVIIDEAHKIYAPDTPAAEKPDTKILEKMIQKSYADSGKDSVRLLLMTATPYTKSPVEMMRLMNLLRREKQALPDSFDDVLQRYLNREGHFTASGRRKFLDDVAGYISYLDRSADARNFAYPVIEDVVVDMSKVRRVSDMKKENRFVLKIKDLKKKVRIDKKSGKLKCKETALKKFAEAMKANANALELAESHKVGRIEECMKKTKAKERTDCRKAAMESYKHAVAAGKNAAALAKSEKKTDMNDCKTVAGDEAATLKEMEAAKVEYEQLKEDKVVLKQKANRLKEEYMQLREMLKKETGDKKQQAARIKKIKDDKERKTQRRELMVKYAHLKGVKRSIEQARMNRMMMKKREELVAEKIGTRLPNDLSQELSLSKRCKITSQNVVDAKKEADEAKIAAKKAKEEAKAEREKAKKEK